MPRVSNESADDDDADGRPMRRAVRARLNSVDDFINLNKRSLNVIDSIERVFHQVLSVDLNKPRDFAGSLIRSKQSLCRKSFQFRVSMHCASTILKMKTLGISGRCSILF
jgi:hypothetical protein